MKKARAGMTGLLALCALCAGLFAAVRGAPLRQMPDTAAAAVTATGEPERRERRDPLPLFPDIDEASVTSVAVSSQHASYSFLRDAPDDVSVNGQKADSEAFDTLLCQITTLPVSIAQSFSASESPLLTIHIVSGGTTHTASFYEGGSRNTALILCGTQDAPLYRQTSAWRVGTLLLTCEGTRIQDESGNETPAE